MAKIAQLRKENEQLRARVAELEQQLAQRAAKKATPPAAARAEED